jgi:hypothetical protein
MLDLFIIKSFLPELFLSFCVLFQLINNAFFINSLKNNFPLISIELIGQSFFILLCVIFLLLNNNVESFFYNSLFITTISNKYLKIFFIIICLFVLYTLFKSFDLQKLNFFE